MQGVHYVHNISSNMCAISHACMCRCWHAVPKVQARVTAWSTLSQVIFTPQPNASFVTLGRIIVRRMVIAYLATCVQHFMHLGVAGGKLCLGYKLGLSTVIALLPSHIAESETLFTCTAGHRQWKQRMEHVHSICTNT